MKSLQESLLDDDDKLFKDTGDVALINNFLKENYIITGEYKINNGIVDVNGSVKVKNRNIENLTNGLFKFGEVSSYFEMIRCNKLKTLEGAPKKCYRFDCIACKKLKTLEGAPEKIELDFICDFCTGLKSLKGCTPVIPRTFSCSNCKILKTLEGAPKEVGEYFYCNNCGINFDEEDVKAISDVKKRIFC